jgi:hypothetical protein
MTGIMTRCMLTSVRFCIFFYAQNAPFYHGLPTRNILTVHVYQLVT